MKNIVNLLKYNLKSCRTWYIVEGLILAFGVFSVILSDNFSILVSVPVVSVIFLVNLIMHISVFASQLGDDLGKFIFMTPIKPIEYVVSKYVEFTLVQGIFTLVTIFISKMVLQDNALYLVTVSMFAGFSYLYLIYTSMIMVVASYVNKTSFAVVLVIFFGFLFMGIQQALSEILVKALPYVYLRVDGLFEVGLIPFVINVVLTVALLIFGIKRFRKIDIA
ncbi:MAG: hypothetical protein ACRC7N_07520 [Clostridium sp.]